MTHHLKWFRACFLVAALVALLFAAWLLIAAWRLPADAPLARMYRTEADLASLVKVVELYRRDCGAYPPAGVAGLMLATKAVSRRVNYFPSGPPPDGWERPFCYVPSAQYGEAGTAALKNEGAYFAPDTFQIYSMGEDGDPGINDTVCREDNIVSWEPRKPWRAVYARKNAAYKKRDVTR